MDKYNELIKSKVVLSQDTGIKIDPEYINQILKPHQKDMVIWGAAGGCRAICGKFGTGKTMVQLELARLFVRMKGGFSLIIMPLGVKQEFEKDAEKLGIDVVYVRCQADVDRIKNYTEVKVMITNYERVRDGDIDPSGFTYVSLDEASVLRGSGSKTYIEFVPKFKGVQYRTIATATPAPNDYIELLNYANFLGIMDVGQSKTRFFKRNSEKADKLTLLPNMEKEFWLWVSSWALFIEKPSDLGHSDEGYDLPEMKVHWHRIAITRDQNFVNRMGQIELVAETRNDLQSEAREKQATISERLEKVKEIIANDPGNYIIWHHLEPERKALEKAGIEDLRTVFGSQSQEKKQELIMSFANGEYSKLATKEAIAGQGCNFQRFCHKSIHMGINHKFNDLIQSLHRIHRFLQEHDVDVHLIYTDAEETIRRDIEKKWKQYNHLMAKMTAIIREFGLNNQDKIGQLKREMEVERMVEKGKSFELVRNDAFRELIRRKDNSIHMHLSSWPFSIQYEYVANYHDLGHNKSNDAFWRQMDFIIPELFRTLMPGRIAAIHAKDRVEFGNWSGLGFPTFYEFSDDVVKAMKKHGFGYCGRITIPTDVVRENSQTYRLGWSENAKDSTKMGVGAPEYVLLFRKPQSDRSKGYADLPVTKDKEDYTIARWQLDANSHWNTDYNRFLTPAELARYDLKAAMHRYKVQAATAGYDFEEHVKLQEMFQAKKELPPSFAAFPPITTDPNVWCDITRMRTLNTEQGKKREEQHLCPLPFDIVKRLIIRYTNKGETVCDTFNGIGTTVVCSIELDRFGLGIDLSESYWKTSVRYSKEAEYKKSVPTLFDVIDGETQKAS